jgi:iron(III) transport system ATP-binding protein
VLESQYYLGDVDDCRVRVGETLVRVIANGYEYKDLKDGQKVRMNVRSFIVFEDNGLLEQMLKIQT